MVVSGEIPTEVEVFGVSYERYALQKLFARLKKKLNLQSILELPASGAKAMPSLYSLGAALAGCDVTLVDADAEGLAIWDKLGLDKKLITIDNSQLDLALKDGSRWDLCWNFMVIPTSEDPAKLLQRMASCSSNYLMLMNVNRFNVGFNMHRTVHRLWEIPWTHGDIRFFSPFITRRFLKELGYKPYSWGVVDSPPWPDSPGFRDLRLHRLGDTPKKWISPYADYVINDQFPSWMKWVYMGERLPIPAWMKLPYSHLYYTIAQVDNEAS